MVCKLTMDDWLKPNEEERILKNMVECIMDDLDNFYFDELIMKQYKKELFQFFTKISEERSLFSPGFDFSNKKNIVNDKEKIKKALKAIDKSVVDLYQLDFVDWKLMTKDLEKIKKILEK